MSMGMLYLHKTCFKQLYAFSLWLQIVDECKYSEQCADN